MQSDETIVSTQKRDSAPDPDSQNSKDFDGQHFVELLGIHERPVFRYVYSLTANWDDAEEVMQRVRLRLWQQFDHYDEEKSFAGWARAIAYYVVLAYRKEKSRRIFSEAVLAQLSKTYDDIADDVDERRDAMLTCLNKLSLAKRELVLNYYSNQGAVERVAEMVQMTTSALRQSMYRIRKKLHQCIQRQLGSTI